MLNNEQTATLNTICKNDQVTMENQTLLDTTDQLLNDLDEVDANMKRIDEEEAVEATAAAMLKSTEPTDMEEDSESSDSNN